MSEDKYKVWFRHTGEEVIEEIPASYSLTFREMTVRDIELSKGDNSITHLRIESPQCIPDWISEVASDVLQLRLWGINEESLREDRVHWERLSQLDHLKVLNISNNSLGAVPEGVYNLTQLTELYMVQCGITEISDRLSQIDQLRVLNVSENPLIAVPEGVYNLTQLTKLYMRECEITEISDRLSNLTELEVLNITGNNFITLPSAILKLTKLQTLNLERNNRLQSLDPRLLLLPALEKLDCYGCEALISPPYAVCQQGLQAVKQYYSDLKQTGGIKLPIVSAAVIGHRMAGKTSLINSLKARERKLTYRNKGGEDDDTTEVFKIEEIEMGDSQLKIFDFGGDRIYHLAYVITIRSNYIPIVVVNMEEFDQLSMSKGCKEAVRILALDYISHLYTSSPGLESPFLVLTHKDKLSPAKFESRATELSDSLNTLCSEMMEEERHFSKGKSDFCKILIFSTAEQIISPWDIFTVGQSDVNNEVILRILSQLQMRAEQFFTIIPKLWELLLLFFDIMAHLPFILLVKVQQRFPGDAGFTVLRYMHNIGRILWFEHDEALRGYVFHKLTAVTDMIALLFHHRSADLWKAHINAQPNFISFGSEMIQKSKYQKLVREFMQTGVIDEAVLVRVISSGSFPHKPAISLLKAFKLLCGPIQTSPRNTYIIPYFSKGSMDLIPTDVKLLQLRVDISFKGLSPPSYIYSLLTCQFLAPFTDPGLRIRTTKNGAMVHHVNTVSRVVHNSRDRKLSVLVDTPAADIDSSWKLLIDHTDSIINHLLSIWVAARPICEFYCAHCLYLHESEPEIEVDPDWYSPLNHNERDKPLSHLLRKLPSNADPVSCCNDQTNGGRLRVPRSLRFPCLSLTNRDKATVKYFISSLQAQKESLLQKHCDEETEKYVKRVEVQPSSHPQGSVISDKDTESYPPPSTQQRRDSIISDDEDGWLSPSPQDDHLREIRLRAEPTKNSHIIALYNKTAEAYQMSEGKRGRAMIINIENFFGTNALGLRRKGSDIDVKNLKIMLESLKFVTNIKENLTAEEILSAIREETEQRQHNDTGMFFLCLMSHGCEDEVILASDQKGIKLKDIYSLISSSNFPKMAGKPKVVVVQACAGVETDHGNATSNKQAAGEAMKPEIYQSPPISDSAGQPTPHRSSPLKINHLNTDDLLIIKSSFESYKSIRCEVTGSLLIRCLVTTVLKHACHRDLSSLFEIVRDRVRNKSKELAEKYPHSCTGQTAVITNTLTNGRKLYLFPGYNPRL